MIIRTASVHSIDVVTGSLPGVLPPDGAETSVGSVRPSFREVFDGHARYVWRSLLGLGVRESDVPDASQQAFLVVHDRLAANQVPAASLRTFVYGVCLRVAADFRKRAHVRREQLYAEPPEPSHPATQEQAAYHRETLACLEAVLEGLPQPQREAFVLYEIGTRLHHQPG